MSTICCFHQQFCQQFCQFFVDKTNFVNNFVNMFFGRIGGPKSPYTTIECHKRSIFRQYKEFWMYWVWKKEVFLQIDSRESPRVASRIAGPSKFRRGYYSCRRVNRAHVLGFTSRMFVHRIMPKTLVFVLKNAKMLQRSRPLFAQKWTKLCHWKRSANRPKITSKNALFCCKNATLPNCSCFTRVNTTCCQWTECRKVRCLDSRDLSYRALWFWSRCLPAFNPLTPKTKKRTLQSPYYGYPNPICIGFRVSLACWACCRTMLPLLLARFGRGVSSYTTRLPARIVAFQKQ